MKKICNFRPLCWLAFVVILAIASAMISAWCTLIVGLIVFSVLLWSRLPRQFKFIAMMLYLVAIVSYLLTTCYVANPYYRTYDPDAGLRGVILRYVRWYLSLFLSPENADLVYVMLLGDKSVLSYGLRFDFTVSGLAHILVVSGLHVGALYGALGSILRWCRVPQRAHLWIIAPVLLFYGYLCGWQYAIIRAVIMSLIYSLAKHHLRIADSLSVMSLAVVVILIIYPYALVSASFLLSFACVLGYNLWYRKIYQVIPSKSFAMYVSVTLGSFPFLVY
ncbi:MAG: ComEC/Rec2 family competence protein, partial [Clostridia bacterium]|nr:ComEC/Rec2 family competence protein [Clostridia bacterium]